MYDSVDPNAIPLTAKMIGYYVDGVFGPDHEQFGEPGWDTNAVNQWRSRGALMVPIAVKPITDAGIVGDCENGDMTPSTLVSWVVMRRRSGVDPSGYCSFSTWPAAMNAFDTASVPQPHWWIADYDNVQIIYNGAVAKQYAGSALTGHDYDLSVVADFWPGVDSMAQLDDIQAAVNDVRDRVGKLEYVILPPTGQDGAAGEMIIRIRSIDNDAGPVIQGSLNQILTAVSKLNQPTVDAASVAASLVSNTSFLDAISNSVCKRIGSASQ